MAVYRALLILFCGVLLWAFTTTLTETVLVSGALLCGGAFLALCWRHWWRSENLEPVIRSGRVRGLATPAVGECRYCRQPVALHNDVYLRSCESCRAVVLARDAGVLSTIREDAPVLFEDTVSPPYVPGQPFSRDTSLAKLFFGSDRPGESHTNSLRDFMQYPSLHRERFLNVALAELSEPATLVEEALSGGVTRLLLARPEMTYRSHRPRSLGRPGVSRLDCHVAPNAAGPAQRGKAAPLSYVLTVANYVFISSDDVDLYLTAHESEAEAKQAAVKYLSKRYREIRPEHAALATELLAGDTTTVISDEQAVADLLRFGVAVVGEEKAGWLPDLAEVWDGTTAKLLVHVRACATQQQVQLLIGMLPGWKLSYKELLKAVQAYSPALDDEATRG